MICCWCGRAISDDNYLWGFHPGLVVHLACFFDYVGDSLADRKELVERLELGGES